MSNLEQLHDNKENNIEARQSAAEQLEKLRDAPELSVESLRDDIEAKTEKARLEALEIAKGTEKSIDKETRIEKNATSSRRGPIAKKQLDESYKRTIKEVQSELSTGSALFSKIIHNKFVEATSDAIGNTIARPNAILSGAVAAFALTLIIYTIAKTIGYALSGFETIAAFIIGWVFGIIYDYLRVMITGKKS